MFIETVQLQKIQMAAAVAIDERESMIRNRGRFDHYRDEAARRLVTELRVAVYAEKDQEEHVIRYPKDWWQAVKERFAPSWFRDRYPVVFEEVKASLRVTYPNFKPKLPDEPYTVQVHIHRNDFMPIW